MRVNRLERNAGLLLGYVVLAALTTYYLVRSGSTGELNFYSVQSIFNNAMPLVLVAVGQTFVILTGGIDLSVGAVVAVANCLAATQMHDSLASMILWSVLIILLGCAFGGLNGVFVAFGRLQPIIVTLATLSIGSGVALLILAQPGGQIPASYAALFTGALWGVVPSAAVAVGVVGLVWIAMRRTSFAVAIYAIGDDRDSARANGIPVRSATISAYVLSGMFAAMGGLFLSAVTTSGDPNAGTPFILTSIAAVVLGGVTLSGGKGSAAGSIAGAFVLTLITNVLFLANVSPYLQDFFEGIVLIVALAANVLLTRLLAGRGGRVGVSSA